MQVWGKEDWDKGVYIGKVGRKRRGGSFEETRMWFLNRKDLVLFNVPIPFDKIELSQTTGKRIVGTLPSLNKTHYLLHYTYRVKYTNLPSVLILLQRPPLYFKNLPKPPFKIKYIFHIPSSF